MALDFSKLLLSMITYLDWICNLTWHERLRLQDLDQELEPHWCLFLEYVEPMCKANRLSFMSLMCLQGIILKENGKPGDAERMFIQVSLWMSFIHLARSSRTNIFPQFIGFIRTGNKTSYEFFSLSFHAAGTILCTRESQGTCGPICKEMIDCWFTWLLHHKKGNFKPFETPFLV